MANLKISQLDDGTAVAAGDLGIITRDVAGTLTSLSVPLGDDLAAKLAADGGVAVLIDTDPATLTHSSAGALDLSGVAANAVRVTVEAAITSLTPPTADPASGNIRDIAVTLVQDGTGGHAVSGLADHADVTLAPGTVAGVVDTAANAETEFLLSGNSAGQWTLYGDPEVREEQLPSFTLPSSLPLNVAISGDGDYTLISDHNGAATITNATDIATDTGTATITFKIGSTAIAGISISATTTPSGDDPATGDNTVADGDALIMTVASASGDPTQITGTLHGTRPIVLT